MPLGYFQAQSPSLKNSNHSGEPSRISWASTILRQCNLATFKTFCEQPAQKTYGYSNGDEPILTVIREVLRNNY